MLHTIFQRTAFLFLLLFVFITQMSVAQTFSGHIIAEDSTSIPYSTIYSRESGIGITADGNGMFSARVPAGHYSFEVSALGFEARTVEIDIDDNGYDCTVMLREQVYQLKGVTVTGGNETPAYRVMRNVLAYAARNRRQIESYSVTNYAKGTGRITEIPSIFKLSDDYARDSAELLGSAYVMEGVYDIDYKYPDNYNTVIKAFKSSFPLEVPVQIWNPADMDFYSDYVEGCVSPMGKNAFSAYTFELEGYYMNDEGRMINKIRVKPKSSGSMAFTGHIYIVEDLWCLSDADLYTANSMYSINLVVNAKEMRAGVFLPATLSMKMKISVMGMDLTLGIFSSSNYSEINIASIGNQSNAAVADVSTVIESPRKKERAEKIEKKISQIMKDGELTTKKALEVVKLNEKLSELQLTDTLKGAKRYNLDLQNIRNQKVENGAMTRDSLFWDSVRLVPLMDDEAVSYRKEWKNNPSKDSLRTVSAFDILAGHRFYNKSKRLWVKTPGLDGILFDINAVDGYNVGADVELGVDLKNRGEISLRPWGYYLTHRKDPNYGAELKIGYAPSVNGQMSISGGRETADYNGTRGVSRYLNMISTYLFANNYAKFYENRFVRFSNSVDIANGLNLAVGAEYTRRSILQNTMHKSGKRWLEPNIPASVSYREMPLNSMMHFSGTLQYTPAYFYRYISGKKVYIKSKYPTFTVSYAHGFSVNADGAEEKSRYNRLEFGVRQKIDFMLSSLSYWVNGGMFVDSENVYFPDFRHAPVNPSYISLYSDNDRFLLPGNYEYSTSDKWISGGVSFKTGRLLLNFIPFLGKPINSEGLGVRTMAVKGLPVFTEIEYRYVSLETISISVALGLRGKKYEGVGFTVGIPIGNYLYQLR